MKRRVSDLPDDVIRGKRALVRVDFNVPLENGAVSDDTRIRASLPTIEYLLARSARCILVSHLGRPHGARDAALTLRPVAERLNELMSGVDVRFVDDSVGEAVRTAVAQLPEGSVLVLENIRFQPGEESDDPALGGELAALADVYVNDAFGSAHRAHASTHAAAQAARSQGKPAVAGLLLDRELEFLGEALHDPKRPFVAVLGGAKISGKIDVIEALLPRVDRILIGGAMANTFFRSLGLETGRSLIEPDRVAMAAELLDRAGTRLILPVDCVVASGPDSESGNIVARDEVGPDTMILDIGPSSVATFGAFLGEARTVLWNGPMGMFERPPFAEGTRGVAWQVVEATDRGALTIAGGGDTAAALEAIGARDRLSHVSTGGGAALEFLEGRELPGVAALDERA